MVPFLSQERPVTKIECGEDLHLTSSSNPSAQIPSGRRVTVSDMSSAGEHGACIGQGLLKLISNLFESSCSTHSLNDELTPLYIARIRNRRKVILYWQSPEDVARALSKIMSSFHITWGESKQGLHSSTDNNIVGQLGDGTTVVVRFDSAYENGKSYNSCPHVHVSFGKEEVVLVDSNGGRIHSALINTFIGSS